MIVRALDWNWNVGRGQKVDELGEPQWKEKVTTLFFVFVARTKFKRIFGLRFV